MLFFNGKLLVYSSALVSVLLMGLLLHYYNGISGESILASMRIMLKVSFVLFFLVFTSSALSKIINHPVTNWLKLNQRYLGLSFAIHHLIVGCCILVLATQYNELFLDTTYPLQRIVGTFSYFMIVILAMTSSNRAVTLITPTLWKYIHVFGIYMVWTSFVFSYVRHTMRISVVEYLPFLIATVLALGLRIYVWLDHKKMFRKVI
jgi:sulfoxide reductase heme-binding subunit YedZ